MRKSRGEKLFYLVLVVSLIMVNPPVLGFVNNYAASTPITLGLPTIWLWLQFWYVVMIVAFIVSAVKLKSWKKEY